MFAAGKHLRSPFADWTHWQLAEALVADGRELRGERTVRRGELERLALAQFDGRLDAAVRWTARPRAEIFSTFESVANESARQTTREFSTDWYRRAAWSSSSSW